MTNQLAPPPTSDRRPSLLPWLLIILIAVPLIACLLFAVVTVGGFGKAASLIQDVLDGGVLVVRDPNPAVITQVQELGRLETAMFTVEKVIEGNVDQGNDLLNFFLGDRVLLVAHGEAIAGVDLTELREGDVAVSEDRLSVRLRLPPAQILVFRLDNEQSYVYDRQTGLLTKGDPGLETSVRQAAEQQILQAACNGGILAHAETNAQRQVKALLQSMGFSEVLFDPPRAGGSTGCP